MWDCLDSIIAQIISDMPVDLEMFLSATRPNLFPYSHYVDDRYSLTNSYDDRDYRSSISLPRNNVYIKSNSRRFGFIQDRSVFTSYDTVVEPKSKSRKDSSAESSDGTRKKKVSFADDKGFNLVQVREIPGSPKWADQVLTLLTSVPKSDLRQVKEWKSAFEHPPWKDDTLLEHLEKNKVVLESVTVRKDRDGTLRGTIKVKNLAYEKDVFVRITFDRWISHLDVKASYVKPRIKSSKPDSYDTFAFSTKIGPAALRYEVIEFCVCFQCNGEKYWDNNGGINYRFLYSAPETSTPVHQYHDDKLSDDQITVSLTENIENISEIDAWSNFMYNQPYW